MTRFVFLLFTTGTLTISCNNSAEEKTETDTTRIINDTTNNGDTAVTNRTDSFPAPFATPSVRNMSKVIGWPADKTPVAPAGFTVSKFADSLESPRWIYVAKNGDIFVAQADREGKKGNNILLFRDKNKDGIPESRSVYLSGLKQPFGMLILNNSFYVANTGELLQYKYDSSATAIKGTGKSLVRFPTGRHWTRNIIANDAGTKIYIAIGSASNIAEDGFDKEIRRANILEISPDGKGERVYASGLRNPVGMDWAPGTNTLWTAVNERDELGDDLVPDYLTSVQENGFYGWPYSYFGKREDPRIKEADKRPDLVSKAIVPEVALGSHTASLGLVFYRGNSFPAQYHNGAFIGQHGSWNRSQLVGYKVVYVPFAGGRPSGPMQDFLTGFIADASKSEVYGRPVGVAVLADGSLLVADDGGNKIWRVAYKK
jgi:glucose/arabinose dehydrogenase